MRTIVLLISFSFSLKSFGQSINGTSRLINTPDARIIKGGSLIIGGVLIPQGYFRSSSGLKKMKLLIQILHLI